MLYDTLISVADLRDIQIQEQVVILDCTYYLNDVNRGRKEYLHGHIPGAFYLDIGLDLSSPVIPGVTGRHPLPDPEVLTFALRACGINDTSQVVAYDQKNGVYASRAWWLLNWLGHPAVAVLDGGFEAWKKADLPVDNAWPAPKNGDFKPQIHDELTSDKQDVATTSNDIIDSREYPRYLGVTEPIDPIAGHIKGAVCLPYLDNVDDQGHWKSKAFFQKKFETLSTDPERLPIFYCGSGVTACHNLLAYRMATGLHARLYGGSWSEWINYYPAVVGA